mgnify:CR=1 FL=1
MSDLKAIIEALIFASPEPVTLKALAKLLESEPKEEVDAAIAALRADYDFELGGSAKGSLGGDKTVNLSAGPVDPARLRETLSLALFRAAGVPAPRAALAEVQSRR